MDASEKDIRNEFRVAAHKKRIYSRVPSMIDLATKVFFLTENQQQCLSDLLNYVSTINGAELKQFGAKFPYDLFFDYIISNITNESGIAAFRILALSTNSRKGKPKFYQNPQLIELCTQMISSDTLITSVLQLYANGSVYSEEFAFSILDSNIIGFLIQLPITVELSILVYELTAFDSIYLPLLFQEILQILSVSLSLVESLENYYKIIHFAFKSCINLIDTGTYEESLHIDAEIKGIICGKAEIFFQADEEKFLRSYFKILARLTKIPSSIGQQVLYKVMCNYKGACKWKDEGKTIKAAMVPFSTHFLRWKAEIGDFVLTFVFSYCEGLPYKTKKEVFNVLVLYFTDNVYNQFTIPFVNWCLYFLENEDTQKLCLEKLGAIAIHMNSNIELLSIINSGNSIYEELCQSDNNEVSLQASNLLEILASVFGE